MGRFQFIVFCMLIVLFRSVAGFAQEIPAPVAHWAMEDADNLGTDSAGKHHGTVIGNVRSVEGRVGKAAFIEDKSYIEVPYAADLEMSSFTVAAWVKFERVRRQGAILGTRFGGDHTFDLKSDGGSVHADLGDGTKWLNNQLRVRRDHAGRTGTNGATAPEQWRLIIFVIDGDKGECRMHMEGDLKRVMTFEGKPRFMKEGQTLRLGSCADREFVIGALDEVRLWNVALTDEQVMQLAGIDPASRPALKPDEVPIYPIGQTQAASAFGHGNLMQTSMDRRSRTSTLVEYDRQGNVVQSIGLPATQTVEENRYASSAVGSDGRVHFFHGVFDAELASLDLATGQLTGRRMAGASMPGVTYYGHLAALGPYVFCTDANTGSDEPGQQGIVRYNVETGQAHRGLTNMEPADVAAGFDGWLYVLDQSKYGVHVVHPQSMTPGERFNLPRQARAIGVERSGTIIIASSDDFIYRVDREGNVLATSPEKRGGLCDVDVDEDGTILVASMNGAVTILDESLAFAKTIERRDVGDSFASWVKAPPALTQAAPPTQVIETVLPTPATTPTPPVSRAPTIGPGVTPLPSETDDLWKTAMYVGLAVIVVIVGAILIIMNVKKRGAATAEGDLIELDDSLEAPGPEPRGPLAPGEYSPGDLRLLGTCQRGILACVLLQIVLFALAASLLKEMPAVTLGLGIPVTIFAVIMVFKLAARLHGETMGILLTILTAIPLIGLFVLLSINGKTTRILRDNNISVGFMGADPSDLPPPGSK